MYTYPPPLEPPTPPLSTRRSQRAQNCVSLLCGSLPLAILQHPGLLPGESQGPGSLAGCSQTRLKRLSNCSSRLCVNATLSMSHPPLSSPPPSTICPPHLSIPVLQTASSVPFARFHIHALIYNICFSVSDFLHSA